MNKLVKFNIRLSDAFGESVQILTPEDMQKLQQVIDDNTVIYYGEISGKHSEVYGPLESYECKIISEDPNEIAVFEKLFGNRFGAFDMMENINEALNG